MLAREVKVGGTYWATVSAKRVRVRIDEANPTGKGWFATNLETNRQIRIRSGGRLTPRAEDRKARVR